MAVNARGEVPESLGWQMRLLCCIFFLQVQRSPAYLRRLAAFLAPPGMVVIVRYAYKGTPQSLVFAQPPVPAPPARIPMTAEVRISEAGGRIDATQLVRQLRAASEGDLDPEVICAYLSHCTGVYPLGMYLTEVFIAPSATGPVLMRRRTLLAKGRIPEPMVEVRGGTRR